MVDITLSPIESSYASVVKLNDNFDLIEEGLADAVSKSVTSTMTTDIDMNSNQLLNLATPTLDHNAATKEYVDSTVGVDYGTGVRDALTEDVGTDGSFVVYNGDLGTPSDGDVSATTVTATRGTVNRTLADHLGDRFKVENYASIQAAITAAEAAGGGIVEFPTYEVFTITSALTVDADRVTIEGNYCTILLDEATGTQDVLTLGNGTTLRSNIRVRNLTIRRNQIATDGAGVRTKYIATSLFENVRVYGEDKIHQGWELDRLQISRLENCRAEDCVSNGLYAYGTGTGNSRTVDVNIDGGRFESNGGDGLNFGDYVEGVFVDGWLVSYNNTGWGVKMDGTSDANGLVSHLLSSLNVDSNGGGGLYINDYENISLVGLWSSNNTGNAVEIASNAGVVSWSGGQVYGKAGSNAVVIDGDDINMSGVVISGGVNGVTIGANATRVTITGGFVGNCTAYGIDASATPDRVVISGTLMRSNTTGDFTGSPTNSHIQIVTSDLWTLIGNPVFQGTAPTIRLYESDGGADAKYAQILQDTNNFRMRFENDARSSQTAFLTCTRSGTTPQMLTAANLATGFDIATGGFYMGTSNLVVDSIRGIRFRSYSQTELRDITNAVNTGSKTNGKGVWDGTNGKPVWAAGSTAASVWVNADGTTAHTPV